jgi:ribonuclease E
MASDETPTDISAETPVETPSSVADGMPPADSSGEVAAGGAATDGATEAAPVKTPRKRAAKKSGAKSSKKAATADEPVADGPTGAQPAAGSAEGETPVNGDAPAKAAKKAAKSPSKAKAKAAKAEPTVEPVTVPGADGESEDEDAEETQDAAADAAPAAPAFGLLFQAPEAPAPRRRRATSPAQAPTARPFEPTDTEAGAPESGTNADTAADPSTEATDQGTESGETNQSAEGEGAGRRRRRGGRGRRGRAGSDSTDGAETPAADASDSPSETAEADNAPSTGPATDEADSEGSASARRRRRRRRSGSGVSEGEDPPGTVTRVREPRAQRDEPTAVKGSTRLEAKKQRRREGREAGRRRTIITEAEFLARRESVERVMVLRGRGDKTQIGVLEDGVLVEHYVSREATASMAGNVYLGRVQNVLPSMEAAFVDIGKGRNAVLYAGEVNWDAAGLEVNQAKRIENALKSGDTVLVQVTKDPIGHKGARLTSQISLPGRFLVYVPEGQMTGISRKLPDTERARLKGILKEIVPDSAGVIVRTAAEGASEEELRADVERLSKIWSSIQKKAKAAASKKAGSGGAPLLVHGEADLTVRVIRDVFTEDFSSLVVSGDKAWSDVSGYVSDVAPDLAERLTQWTEETDVFTKYRVDEQIAKAMDRKVWLPSGGSLVIDRTEAMTVVDVNTGKFVGSGGNLEETVTKNNIEAAEEIVRQLRLRDIGGIIVIDFIDMVLESNRDLVVRRLLECLGRDRTKHQVAEVTSLGLVQMTRKRVGSGLIEVFSEPCEHCAGRGIIVHSEPVDRAPSESESNHSGQSSSGRSRSRGGSKNADSGRSGGSNARQEKVAPSGPTAAQIAAAAHAAAVKSMSGEAIDDDVAELAAQAPEAVEDASTTPPVDAALLAEAETPSKPKDERGDEPIAQPVDEAVREPIPAVAPDVAAPGVAPVKTTRRKRGRVVAPAGPPRHTDEATSAAETTNEAAASDLEP